MESERRQMYHWRQGLYFNRLPYGDVQILQEPDCSPPCLLLPIACIPTNEWCSIVAAMSATGKTAEVYAAIKKLHGMTEIGDTVPKIA